MRRLLAILLLLIATPAQAQAITKEEADVVIAIAVQLKSMGITITMRDSCGTGWLASYNAATNDICLNSGLFVQSNPQGYKALVHEAAHVVQDCVDGLHNHTSVWLGSLHPPAKAKKYAQVLARNVTADEVNAVAHLSDGVFLMEIEAYAMERDPASVLKLLRACPLHR